MRYEVLDSWRGVCALTIALLHFDALHHAWGLPLLRNAYLFVDFFFVLSGFVISHAYAAKLDEPAGAARFMVRRFGRVWPLHAALLGAYLALETVKWLLSAGLGFSAGLAAFESGGRVDLATLPSQLALTQGLGIHDGLTWNLPSWSISAEFWTYALFAIVSVAAPRVRAGVLAVLAAASLITLAAFSPDAMFAAHDLGFPRAVLGFAFGHFAWLARTRAPAPELRTLHANAVELSAVLVVIVFVWSAGRGPLSFAAPLVFALVVFVFSFEGGGVSRLLLLTPFRKLGLWSYSIYMVHDFVMYAAGLGVSVMQRLIGADLWRELDYDGEPMRVIALDNRFILDAAAIAYLALVIWLASLTYRAIEDPARRIFNRWSDSLGARRAA